MNKELRVRMLAKTERHRIRRKAWRKFLRRNPDYERNVQRSIDVARSINQFRKSSYEKESRYADVVRESKPSIFRRAVNTLQSIFRRKG